jgi:hypothetical protein
MRARSDRMRLRRLIVAGLLVSGVCFAEGGAPAKLRAVAASELRAAGGLRGDCRLRHARAAARRLHRREPLPLPTQSFEIQQQFGQEVLLRFGVSF